MMFGLNQMEKLIISDVSLLLRMSLIGKKLGTNGIILKGYRRQLEMYQWLFRKNVSMYQIRLSSIF